MAMKCLKTASKEDCRAIFICLNSVNVELRDVCVHVFTAAPDLGLVSEEQQSTCRWPPSCIFQQKFPHVLPLSAGNHTRPLVDSFNSAVKILPPQDPQRVFEDSKLYGTSWFVRHSWKFVLCLFETAWLLTSLSPKINLCTREASQMLKLMLPLRESSYHLHHIQIQAAALSNEQQSGMMSCVSGPLSRGERERRGGEREEGRGRKEERSRTGRETEGRGRRGRERWKEREREAKKGGEKERGRDKVGLKLSPSCMLLKEQQKKLD